MVQLMGPAGGQGGAMLAARASEGLISRCGDERLSSHAQLVVEEGDAALLLRDGQLVGILGPGRHTLVVEAYPFLQGLQEPGGGYRATIYFIRTGPVSGLRFGGQTGMLSDRQGGHGQARLFGQFTARIANPRSFLPVLTSVGAGEDPSEGALRWFGAQLKQRTEACLLEWLNGGYYTLENASAAGPHLAQAVTPHCADFAEQGFELVRIDEISVMVR